MPEKQKYPEVTVGALVINKEGKILFVKSHKWFDRWTIPGGHVEIGETLKEAMKREVKEEVGLDVEIIDLLATQEAIFTREFWKKKHFIFFDFLCRCKDDKVTVDNDEIQNYVWVKPEEASGLNLSSFTKNVLQEYLKKNKNGNIGL